MEIVEQIERSNNDTPSVYLNSMETQSYTFINASKNGAYYIDYYEKIVNDVTYTLEETEGIRWIQFTMTLTPAEKDQLLTRDSPFELDVDYDMCDTDPSCIGYTIYATDEREMDEVNRSTIPEELRNELEQIQYGDIGIEDFGWSRVNVKIMIDGGVDVIDELA